ncbi:MAG: outer membrane beta-barrel protein [Burkholderiales bacterium]
MTAARTLVLAIMFGSATSVAFAQARVPDSGMAAASGNIGVIFPEEPFEADVTLSGALDYYLTPRLSLRPGVMWANPGVEDHDESLRRFGLLVDVIYNWEQGKWHPFVGAGVGAYFFQPKAGGQSFRDSETNIGGTVGGGLEYFTSRTTVIKGEAQYYFIDQGNLPQSPSAFALMIGVKRYF